MEKRKVVIVDDEPIIIDLIIRLGDWDGLNLEIAATETDGLRAAEVIDSIRPDIVILDIRMPGMDGLELIKYCKKEQMNMQYLIISGYQEFEYAKQAISLNISEYLVKPIDQDELNHALRKICLQIEENERAASYTQKIQETLEQKNMRIWSNFFAGLLKNDFRFTNEKAVNDEYGTSFSEGAYRIAAAKFDTSMEQSQLIEEMAFPYFQRQIQEHFEGKMKDIVVTQRQNLVLTCLNSSVENFSGIEAEFQEIALRTNNYVKNYAQRCSVTIALSEKTQQVKDLPQLLEQALQAVEYRRIGGVEKVWNYSNFSEKEKSMLRRAELPIEWKESLYKIVSSQNEDALETFFEEVHGASDYHSVKRFFFLKEIWNYFISIVEEFDPELMGIQQIKTEIDFFIDNTIRIDKIEQELVSAMKRCFKRMNESERFWNERHVHSAKRYIEMNYNKQIQLEDVASAVNLNATYFSTLFKQKTGMTYLEYLQTKRIEAAKDLFSTTHYSIKEVSNMVGYIDVKYFSKLFKQFVGIKPSAYKKMYGKL